MKYRKKPVVIEAVQWKGDNMYEIMELADASDGFSFTVDTVRINTLEGTMIAEKGDWIIKGIKGEFYPCKSDIFELTYEKV